MSDIILNKVASIQRCVQRAREIHHRHLEDFLTDYDAQDAAVLNVMRGCELSIDLANHLIKERRLGLPRSSADSFQLLVPSGILSADLAGKLGRMVGFRNISVHQYRELNLEIVVHVIEHELDDLVTFTTSVLAQLTSRP